MQAAETAFVKNYQKTIDDYHDNNLQSAKEVEALMSMYQKTIDDYQVKHLQFQKLPILQECPQATSMQMSGMSKTSATQKAGAQSDAPKKSPSSSEGLQPKDMHEQAFSLATAYVLFIEKTKMPPYPYYLYITKKRPEFARSMEKAHMMEMAKLEKAQVREIAHKLTDMWLKSDPDSKQ